MQNRLFRLGFGPLPYFRRPGVLLRVGEQTLGVIVAHQPGMHGCRYGCGLGEDVKLHADERCYFCQDNPFYEVVTNHALGNQGLRMLPEVATEKAVATGSRLLLRASALERLVPGFKYSDNLSAGKKRKKHGQRQMQKKQVYGNAVRSRKMAMLHTSQCIVGMTKRQQLLMLQDAAESEEEDEDEEGEEEGFVQCFLNVTPIVYAKDGFVCVAVASCSQAKNSAKAAENMYVYPEDLKVPGSAQEWEDALSHIVA